MWSFCPQGKNKILSGAQRRGTPYFLSFIYYLEMRSASCSSKSKKRYRCAGVWAVMPSAPNANWCAWCAARKARSALICAAKHRGAARICAPRPPALPKRARPSGWNARLRFPSRTASTTA